MIQYVICSITCQCFYSLISSVCIFIVKYIFEVYSGFTGQGWVALSSKKFKLFIPDLLFVS